MWIFKAILASAVLFLAAVKAQEEETKDLCQQPNVVNGHVTVVTDTNNVFSGSVECDNGYTLVGRDRIKCRNGIWSSSTPVCTHIGSCEVRDLPEVKNARRIMVRPYRGSVVRFKCRRGYHLFGPRLFHCVDHKEWSHLEAPVCVRPGCDETQMHQIPYGMAKKHEKGAVYQFECEEGAVLSGSPTVYCDGYKWNDTAPTCLSPPGEPSLQVRVDNDPLDRSNDLAVLRAGQTVELRCTAQGGNPVPTLTFTKNGQSFGPGPTPFQSTLDFVATAQDNGANLSCAAQNTAVDRRIDSHTVKLNVLFPPESLTIEGPEELTKDHPAHFTCKASASNLPSKLGFKVTSHHADLLSDLIKDDLVILEEPKESWVEAREGSEVAGWASSRSLIMRPGLLERADQLGEQITFECQVPDPYHERRILISASKYVELRVPKPPQPDLSLHIDGPSEIRYNEIAQFRCSANRDNIELEWKLDQKLKSDIGKVELILQPGQIRHGERRVTLECSGMDEKSDIVSVKHDVEVLYPPSTPEISGKAQVSLGFAQKLTCTSQAGYPPAKLSWFRGSAMMESHYSVEGDVVKAEVTFVPKPEDDGSQLRCEAVNEAVSKPVYNTITIELMPSTTVSTTTTTKSTTEMDIIDKNTVLDNDYYYSEEYDDELYSTDPSYTDPQFTHPELTDPLFHGKIRLPTTQEPIRVQSVDDNSVHKIDKKSQMQIDEAKYSENEVFPKDAPYTQGSAKVNSLSFCVLLSTIILAYF